MGGRFSFTEMMWNKTPEFGASIEEKSKKEITVCIIMIVPSHCVLLLNKP